MASLAEEAECLMVPGKRRRVKVRRARDRGLDHSHNGKASGPKAYGRSEKKCEVGMLCGQEQNYLVLYADFGM